MTPPRDTAGVIAPPPLIYLGFLLLGWGIDHLADVPAVRTAIGPDAARWLGSGFGFEPTFRWVIALTLIISGILMNGIAAGHFRRLGTPPQPWKPTTALATGGLYRFSRNPIYLGFAVTYAGLAIALNSVLALVLLAPCLLIVDRLVIAREERYLAGKFGAEYDSWRARVRRWL